MVPSHTDVTSEEGLVTHYTSSFQYKRNYLYVTKSCSQERHIYIFVLMFMVQLNDFLRRYDMEHLSLITIRNVRNDPLIHFNSGLQRNNCCLNIT